LDATQFSLLAALAVLVVVNIIALTWASVQDRKARSKPQPKIYDIHLEGTKVFSDIDLENIQKAAKEQLAHAAQEAASRLQKSLNNSVDQVAANMNDSLSTVLTAEFEKYQVSLSALRDQTIEQFGSIQQELDHRRLELMEHVDRQVAEEHARRVEAFNARLGDVVASYIAESLGSQVDLGAQTGYILEVLEKHKEDIKRDVTS
jgi:hypothetical protein